MRIENIRIEPAASGERARISASIVWEDCDRHRQDIYYEVALPFADGFACSPQAFVVAALIPAIRHGERRMKIDGAICPELRDGLDVAMGWLHHWHGDARRPIAIEAELESAPHPRPPDERAACFFTGGIDSMATLRHNRLRYAMGHPCSIKDGIIICGLEVDRESAFDAVVKSLSRVADAARMTLLPVYTNVRSLDLDWWFWEFEWEGAVYASVAHALSNRLTAVSISSTYDIPNMNLLGSHPLLDPQYGSATLRVRHDGTTMSRLDKLRLIEQWEIGLQCLRVCNQSDSYREGSINCGRCEKCVRTMLGLAALGVLDRTTAFAAADLTPEAVTTRAHIHSPYMEACYREMLSPLITQGRRDLAKSVEHVLKVSRGELGWQGSLRRFDRRVLGGRLRLARRLFLRTSTAT
jgi:hypothetical protein